MLLNYFIISLCYWTLIESFRHDDTGWDEIRTHYEEGTKAYEFQLDTGARRDERPDSELTYLELLDRNISKILMDPQKGQGPFLIKYIKEFAEQALHLKNMLVTKTEKEDPLLKESAIKVYQRYGHPRFMSVMVTSGGEYLQNMLELPDDLMWEFYGYRQKANGFWDDVRKIMVKDYHCDKVEADRFKNIPWPLHVQNLTDFEKRVMERSDLNSEFDLGDILNVKSTLL
jgi:hypothetical protein